jgi:hypothetical protein
MDVLDLTVFGLPRDLMLKVVILRKGIIEFALPLLLIIHAGDGQCARTAEV